MPLFEIDKFVGDMIADLSRLRMDIATFKALDPQTRKEVIKKLLNKLIDVPGLPDFLEPLLFNFLVEYMENFITSNINKNATPTGHA
jgi:hypothetical protein